MHFSTLLSCETERLGTAADIEIMWKGGCRPTAVRRLGNRRAVLGVDGAAGQILGNVLVSCGELPEELLGDIIRALEKRTSGPQRKPNPARAAAALTKLNVKTIRAFQPRMRARMAMALAGGCSTELPTLPAVCEVESVLPLCDPVEETLEGHALLLPVPDGCKDEDIDVDVFSGAAAASSAPTLLEMWREHPNYARGLLLAETAVMWIQNGWAREQYQPFLAWAASHFPGAIATLNKSKHWIPSFLPDLVGVLDAGIAADIHTIVPATAMPSLLSRVIDIVSPHSGVGFVPDIFVYTNESGRLATALLDLPCCEYKANASSLTDPPETSFRFHAAQNLVSCCHAVEDRFRLFREDRRYRIVVTNGDQALQGPGSVRFSEEEWEVAASMRARF